MKRIPENIRETILTGIANLRADSNGGAADFCWDSLHDYVYAASQDAGSSGEAEAEFLRSHHAEITDWLCL